ncbi:Etoposide induced 2.4 mRNA [Kappamyces sp. JEL0829]|nr:Etoposide induced 2.4 mRNA [Kappamyces sp. JEL0829]
MSDRDSTPRAHALSESVLLILEYFCCGLRDSLQFPITLWVLYGSSTLSRSFVYSSVITASVFAAVTATYSLVVQPLGSWLWAWLPSWLGQSIDARVGANYPWIYYICWTLPTYLFVYELNQAKYLETASRSFEIFVGKPVKPKTTSVASRVIKQLYKRLFLLAFIITSLAFTAIPHVGPAIRMLLFAYLGPYLVFSYKAENRGWEIERNIAYFEARWPYFAGFGFPSLLLALVFPLTSRLGLFSLMFPIYIVMANRSQPRPNSQDRLHLVPRLPLFALSTFVSNNLVKYFKPKSA